MAGLAPSIGCLVTVQQALLARSTPEPRLIVLCCFLANTVIKDMPHQQQLGAHLQDVAAALGLC